MSYEKLYYKLLSERAATTGERHHITPRHAGGKDKDGIVVLSRRDHTLAHYIRYRWLKQPGDLLAYKLMLGLPENAMNISEYREKHLTSVQKTPEWKNNIGAIRRGRTYEELYGDKAAEQRSKRGSRGEKNGMFGKQHTGESLEKIAQAKSKGKLRLEFPNGDLQTFPSKEALIRYGVHRDVIKNNTDKGRIKKGKFSNYKIETVWD